MRTPHAVAMILVALTTVTGCHPGATQSQGADAETTSSARQSVEGRWGTPGSVDGELGYNFEAGGDYKGWDGCNSTSGTWSQDGAHVTLSSALTSDKLCPGLPTPETFTMVGDTLVVTAKQNGTEWKLSRVVE